MIWNRLRLVVLWSWFWWSLTVVCFVILLILFPIVGPASHWFGFGEPSNVVKLEASGQPGAKPFTAVPVTATEEAKASSTIPDVDVPMWAGDQIIYPAEYQEVVGYNYFYSYAFAESVSSPEILVLKAPSGKVVVFRTKSPHGPWYRFREIIKASK